MRVSFLVDGFNVYHSALALNKQLAREAAKLGGGAAVASTKWLDLRAMLGSVLPHIDKSAQLHEVHYFSALAHYREAQSPGTVQRHTNYIDCLKDTGVIVHLGQFKEKDAGCKQCGARWKRPEEKETDVAIATTLLELVCGNQCDIAMIVGGDTDLAPAFHAAKRMAPNKPVGFVFPYDRSNSSLALLSRPLHVKLKQQRYTAHQFANPHICADGRQISKPATW